MRGFRLPIFALMLLVVLVAASFAVLRSPNKIVVSATYLTTLLAILTAAVLGIVRGGRRRGLWLGFSVFGAGYLVFAHQSYDDPKLYLTSLMLEQINPRPESAQTQFQAITVPSTRIFTPSGTGRATARVTLTANQFAFTTVGSALDSAGDYKSAGHTLIGFWFGVLGGFIGVLATRPEREDSNETIPEAGSTADFSVKGDSHESL